MQPTNKQPLFIITGASCAGKSTICAALFANEKDYIVMESDLLWNDIYNTPEDHYKAYRKLWMTVCANISQIGKPVVLCGCNTPEQLEPLPERSLFTDIHYLAVVCSDQALRQRMTAGRGVTDETWVQSSLDFNRWLVENAAGTTPSIKLLDTSALAPDQAAERIDKWILSRLWGGERL